MNSGLVYLRKLHEGAQLTGLCAPNAEKIKAGEFAELCLLLDIYSILSKDFSKTAKYE